MKFKYFSKKKILLLLGDAGIISCSYILSMLIWFGSFHGHDIITLLKGSSSFLVAYSFIFYLLDFYSLDLDSRHIKYFFKHLIGVVVAAGALAIYFFFYPDLRSGRGVFILCAALGGAGTYLWRFVLLPMFKKKSMQQKQLLILGVDGAAEKLYKAMQDDPDYSVLGHTTDDGGPVWKASPSPAMAEDSATLKQIIRSRNINALVLASSTFKKPELLKSALDCKLDGVMVYDMPSFYEKITGKVPVEHVTDFWLVFTPLLGVKKNIYNNKVKRGLDIILIFIGAALALPLALVAAVAVYLDSRGAILYRQKRVGLNGKLFTLLKFRSMRSGTDHDREHAGERDDPRITRTGKVLRFFRIDELPQLWNILKGEMSFFGPRPLLEEEVREFESRIPYFSLRHSIRPGLSGWAQVHFRHGTTVADGLEKFQYDLFYIKNLSPLLDLVILLKTIKVVLFGKGAR